MTDVPVYDYIKESGYDPTITVSPALQFLFSILYLFVNFLMRKPLYFWTMALLLVTNSHRDVVVVPTSAIRDIEMS